MSKAELDNLVRINRLKVEPGSRKEFTGMLKSARTRLLDAQNEDLDPDSQFDLALRCSTPVGARRLTSPGIPVGKSHHGFPDARTHVGFG
jgi:hypothetical protein